MQLVRKSLSPGSAQLAKKGGAASVASMAGQLTEVGEVVSMRPSGVRLLGLDGWAGGWMDGRMVGWMDGWMAWLDRPGWARLGGRDQVKDGEQGLGAWSARGGTRHDGRATEADGIRSSRAGDENPSEEQREGAVVEAGRRAMNACWRRIMTDGISCWLVAMGGRWAG